MQGKLKMDRKLGTRVFRIEAVVTVVSFPMARIKMNGLPFVYIFSSKLFKLLFCFAIKLF